LALLSRTEPLCSASCPIHHDIDPIHHEIDASPNSWVFSICAANSPRRGTVKRPLSIALAHQRTTAVPLASVDDEIACLALCEQHAVVDLAFGPRAVLIVRPGRHLRLLQDIRLTAFMAQSAPSRDRTPRSSNDVARWQACRPDTIVEVEGPVHSHQGEVVGRSLLVIQRVRYKAIRFTILLVAACLHGNKKLTSDHGITESNVAMRSSQHPTRGDDRAAAEGHANVPVAKTDLPCPHALLSRMTVHDSGTRLVARNGFASSATLSRWRGLHQILGAQKLAWLLIRGGRV